jgi:peptidoglycan/LPS O-acetylase OafA/YrhL
MILVVYWLLSVDFRPGPMRIFLDQVWYAILYVYDIFYRVTWFQPTQFLDHFWSLSVEEQFYIAWPLLLLLIPQKHLKSLFILFIFLGVGFRVLLYLWYLSGNSLWFFREPFGLVVYSWPLSHLDAFAFGAYISKYEIWRPKTQLLVLAFLIPILGFAVMYFSTGTIGVISALGYDSSLENGYQFLWAHTLLNYFFAMLIYCVVHEKVFVRFLEMPWLRYLGKISYGMYVYHLALIWFIRQFVEDHIQGEMAYWIKIVVPLSATILVATLSYYFLERPILRLKDRFFAWSKDRDNESSGAIL